MTDNTENNGRDKSGKFTSGNPGRPPLSANKIQQQIRQQLGDFLEGKLSDIEILYTKLPDRDKAKFLLEIVSYFMPKQKEIVIGSTEKEKADYTNWATEDLRALSDLFFKYDPNPTIAESTGRASEEVMRKHNENHQIK